MTFSIMAFSIIAFSITTLSTMILRIMIFSIIFVGKVRSLPYSVAPERHFTQISSGLTPKHYTRLENLASDKDSRLL